MSSTNLHARPPYQLVEEGSASSASAEHHGLSAMAKSKDAEGMILPRTIARETKHDSKRDFLFKAYVIVSMTFMWTAYTLMVSYTRNSTPADKVYNSSSVVLLAEFTKWLIAICCLLRSCQYDMASVRRLLDVEFFGRPMELLKMSVPSIAYAVQNNLDFVALSNLDAGVYQVTTQLKVVTTAVFMVIMLRRRYSARRWFAITLLFAGVAAVQMDAAAENSTSNDSDKNYTLGLIAVLSTCFTAGFAGVYFEKMLKDGGSTPFWIRNLQMYTCGIISASLACVVKDGANISRVGFFYGYDSKVYCIVGLLGMGGIYISLVMKHLDNLHKSFASAFSIILVVIMSYWMFANVHIGGFFLLGSAVVCFAVLLYNSVPE
uniref:Uncharacterized protein n=1 Tax=Plectus sambesii TaxID=2011161 RepID=A0A914W947_9BILA